MIVPACVNAFSLLLQRRWFVSGIINRVTDKPMFAFIDSTYRPYFDRRKFMKEREALKTDEQQRDFYMEGFKRGLEIERTKSGMVVIAGDPDHCPHLPDGICADCADEPPTAYMTQAMYDALQERIK